MFQTQTQIQIQILYTFQILDVLAGQGMIAMIHMDTSLWQKLVNLARRGDRVVIVEGGEGFVVLPLAEYERISNGEASLRRVSSSPIASYQLPVTSDFEKASVDEIVEDDLPPIPDLPDEFDALLAVPSPATTPLASDQLEEEERFYLEPIE